MNFSTTIVDLTEHDARNFGLLGDASAASTARFSPKAPDKSPATLKFAINMQYLPATTLVLF